jgi:hypothetical protein
MGIEVLHHCFMPILHSIDEILETIIQPMKYHSWMHGFIDLSQTKVVNV